MIYIYTVYKHKFGCFCQCSCFAIHARVLFIYISELMLFAGYFPNLNWSHAKPNQTKTNKKQQKFFFVFPPEP
jgi:hypothetical protein